MYIHCLIDKYLHFLRQTMAIILLIQRFTKKRCVNMYDLSQYLKHDVPVKANNSLNDSPKKINKTIKIRFNYLMLLFCTDRYILP